MKESGTAIMVRDQVKLQDKSISQVAREMNMSCNTVKKYLKEGEKEDRRKGTKRSARCKYPRRKLPNERTQKDWWDISSGPANRDSQP